ncbi:MAG: hypothetical protein HKN33_04680 [Pyrinomonadaceae bacterium]|nr:hypothetical protein [Pyrinomonadaceae bacterium]
MNTDTYNAPKSLNRWQSIALGAGGIGVIVWLVGYLTGNEEEALRGWLLGFIFWAGIAIGGLGILMLQYVTGGAWGVVIRRVAEACAKTIPYVGLLFIPIGLGVYKLYEFANAPATDKIIAWRGWYMDPPWWAFRAFVYFVLFSIMAYLLSSWGAKQDASKDYEESAKWLSKATRFSGPSIVIFVLLVTFASVDWMMTLEPHWFSTMWGFLFTAGWALSCFCFSVAILAYFSDKPPLDRVLGKRHFHDIGKLMLALVMVWAYFNFSQYLIIWSGNLTEETPFYVVRSKGGWGAMGLALIVLHFAFPFLILLMQDFKRKAKWLASLAIFILIMRLIDMFYIIGPSPKLGELKQHLLEVPFRVTPWDFAGPIAVGGIWLFIFIWHLRQRPLVPLNDPFFENAIKHGKGH